MPHDISYRPHANTQTHYVLGMRLDYLDWPQAIEQVINAAQMGQSAYCCIPDVNQCVLSHDQPSHREIVNDAMLVMSDSTVLQRVRALLYGVRPVVTIKGADMMSELCRRAASDGIPIALVGGKNEKVLRQLTDALSSRFPAIDITLAYSPPFRPMTEVEDSELVNRINSSGAKLVFVGLGCPKQERWMALHKGRVQAMMIGVGAAFDFLSGAVKPSPSWVHEAGLEWLYRLLREPRRLWKRYLGVAPRFLWLLLVRSVRATH